MVFGQILKILTSAKKDLIGKGISRGTEWRKFQLRSTFHCGVNDSKRPSNNCTGIIIAAKCRNIHSNTGDHSKAGDHSNTRGWSNPNMDVC